MTNSQSKTKFHHFSIYDLLDRKQSMEKAYDLMEIYQRKWLRTHKRGGMVSSVHDVLQAIVSLMPKTMEEIKQEQPNVFEVTICQQEFFCFTNNEYLATMVNKQANRPLLQISGRTVRSCIKKLLDAQILTQKVNYMCTGRDNPKPMHEDPHGRGKFKLVLNKDILIWSQTEAQLGLGAAISDNASPLSSHHIEPSFPQMYSILDNKDTLKQYKTPTGIVDKALANAKRDLLATENTERGNKFKSDNNPNISPQNFAQKVFVPTNSANKEEFLARHLFEQARVGLWSGQNFNVALTEQAIDLLRSHLRLTKDFVQMFRKQKIEEFKEGAYYQSLASNPKHQWKILNQWFANKLPNIELSAVRIVGEAIQKQRENALKRGYLDKLYKPQYYFVSPNWEKALDYSKNDFMKLYTKYSDKNRGMSYYQSIMEQINKAHTAVLQALKDGTTPQHAINTASESWKKLRVMIAKAPPSVTQEQKDKLINKFKDRLQPIFSNQI